MRGNDSLAVCWDLCRKRTADLLAPHIRAQISSGVEKPSVLSEWLRGGQRLPLDSLPAVYSFTWANGRLLNAGSVVVGGWEGGF